jgi:hypothetical protein
MPITFLDEEKEQSAIEPAVAGEGSVQPLETEAVPAKSKITFLDEVEATSPIAGLEVPEAPKPIEKPPVVESIGQLQGITNAAMNAFDASRQSMAVAGGVSPEEAEEISRLEYQKEARKVAPAYQEYLDAGGMDAVKAFAKNPLEISTNIIAEGLAGSLYSLGAGLVAGGTAAGAAAVTGVGAPLAPAAFLGGQIGGTFAGSLAAEYGSKVLEELQNAGMDIKDPESIQKFFADEKLVEQARTQGLKRGVPVAIFDGFSAGIAGRLARAPIAQALKKTPTRLAATEAGVQAGLGGGGEIAGALAAGEEVQPKAVFAEVLGEAGPAAAEITVGRIATKITKTPEEKQFDQNVLAAQVATRASQDVAPATADALERQVQDTISETAETPEQRVARLQEEATAAAGIELEEEGVGVEPTVPVTPPVAPTPEGAVAPVEPVVEPEVAEPQPVAEVAPEAAVTPPAEATPEITPTPETPNLEPLRRVARAEQTEEDVSGLVGQGLVELYNGQPVITQAGLETLPEAERPRLNPEARKIQIDTGSNEVVAEAIAKGLRIGVDQVGTGVRMPAGWTLLEDIYVPPQKQEVAVEAPASFDLNDWVLANYPNEYSASKYLDPSAQYKFHLAVWEKAGRPEIDVEPSAAPAPEVRESRREPAPLTRQDREYLDAVDRGDTETQQRIVNEAARRGGYQVLPLFHGTEASVINRFRKKLTGIWLAFDKKMATPSSGEYPTTVINAYADLGSNPITLTPEQVKEWQNSGKPKDWIRIFRERNRATAIVIGDYATVVFKPSQVKSADSVTRDNQGNIIPPSQRFQPTEEDIRYARREPSVEMRQQYAPKTEEEQASFDKASSNKVLARSPQLAVAAVRMKNGEITAGEYADLVDAIDPFTAKGADPIPTDDKIKQYIQSDKVDMVGFLDKNGNPRLQEGSEYEFRIDINTYNRSTAAGDTVYNITAHKSVPETSKRVGDALAYVGIAKVKNPTFMTRAISGKGSAVEIAAGKGKFPLATVKGSYEPIAELPADINDPNVWTEVGYNPIRSSYFVDVRSKDALVGGSEAIMVGSRVFVKDAVLEPRPTGVTMGERYAKIQMPRPAGMETEAVTTKLESLGFGRGGIVSVVNQPDASFEGRTIIRDGKVVGIELNAAALKDDAAVERVLNHEIAESANADGALNRLVAGLTPKERKEINDAITRLGYAERARTAEEAARAVELLAEGWRGRRWFDRAVARVEAWANKLGYKLTRRAAEYIAARNMAEVNESFRKMSTADALANLRGARRVNFNGLRAVLIPPSEMEFAYSIAAYHGTPHVIKGGFQLAKIGTGEGAQAYGWGLYFAENIDVAREYQAKLSRNRFKEEATKVYNDWKANNPREASIFEDEVVAQGIQNVSNEDFAIELQNILDEFGSTEANVSAAEKLSSRISGIGNLYSVDLNIENDKLLDWDSVFAKQSDFIKNALQPIIEQITDANLGELDRFTLGAVLSDFYRNPKLIRMGSKKEVSEFFAQQGIQGIKYFDRASRFAQPKKTGFGWLVDDYRGSNYFKTKEEALDFAKKAATSNFVVFDENLINITGLNGESVDIRESRREDTIPTFSEGSPEASTLSTMASSMAKVDAASEGKPNPENKPTYKISEIASVWMDQGGDTRQLQDMVVEYTNLTPANAKKVANAIAKQYGLQQGIAEAGAVIAEPAPEAEGAPRKTSVQRFIEQARGIRKPIVKLEVSERAELKRQIQLKAREARETRKARKEAAKEVAAFITQYVKDNEIRGPIKSRQSMALAKQALKLDVNNEKAVDKFAMYVERVIENANYDADLRQAKALVKKAGKLAKSKTAMGNQPVVLEAISNINPSLIDNPFEFNILAERYLLAFAPVTSKKYSVFPDSELLQQLGVFESEAKINQDELNRAAAQRLLEAQAAYADQQGISLDEAQELLNKETNIEEDVKALELEKRTSMENLLTDLSVGIQKELNGYDDSANTPTQKELISFLKKVNVENLLADEKKRYIRFSNNLLANGVTYGLEQFKSIALAQDAAIRGAKDERLSKKFSAWITPFTKKAGVQAYDTAREAARKFASITQSEADTIKNIFGRQATGVVKNLLGLTDLSLAQTAANKADEQIANEVDEFYKGHTKKYGNAGVSEETNAYAAIAAYLIQRSGDKTQEDSVAYRRRLLDENIAELNNGERVQQTREAELKQKIVNDLAGATNAEILNRLKEVNPAAYDQLIWWKDAMLPKWVDFLKAHDENFRNQANNYNNPDFLSIKYMFDDYVKLPTEYEAAGFDDPVSLRVKQAANSIKRKDHPSLPEREGVKANISIKFGKDQYNALTDQVNRAYTAPAWERVYAFTRTPEFEPIMGGRENAKFVKNMLAKIRTAQQGYGGTDIEERMMAGGVAMVRRLASQRALGGFTQMIRQTVPQLVLLAGTSTRWNLALQNMVRFHEGRELMDKFPIGQRANVQGGAKFATQYDELSRRIEASVTNRNWARFRELMKKMGELWMIPLRTSDTWVASVSWMTYYEDELNKRGIQITDWKEEARLVETDNIRKDAAGYAEQQVDQYQGSSDPTKLASLSRQSNSGWREFGRLIIMPLNSFALQEKSRLVSDVRDLFLRSGDRKDAAKGLAGTLGGMLTFHLIAIYLLGAFAMPLGKTMLAGLFGVDLDEPDEEEKEKQLQEKYQQIKTRMFSGVVTGGLGQVVDETGVLAFNRLSYVMDSVIRPDTILNDKGEVVSFRQYEKEFAPLYRYSSFKGNNYSFGLADILSEQAERVMSESGKLLDEDEMSSYTQNEQAFATVATMVEAMYFAGLMDADVTRMIRAGRRQLEQQKKEEESELARIRAGR